MPSADPHKAFERHVRSASGKSSTSAIASALGKLVSAKLKRRASDRTASPTSLQRARLQGGSTPLAPRPQPKRRSPRRLGRNRAYAPTTKPDTSRLGTFRHYMIALMRRHSNTRAAELEHAECDNPKFSKNKLDFNWAADNGYITFEI